MRWIFISRVKRIFSFLFLHSWFDKMLDGVGFKVLGRRNIGWFYSPCYESNLIFHYLTRAYTNVRVIECQNACLAYNT